MRIRYGKPIKAKNILNSFNTVGTGNEYGHMTANKEGYFYHNVNISNLRKFSVISGHKYFLCANTEFALDSFVIMSGTTWYQALFTSPTPTYSDGNSYAIINNVNIDNDNVGLLVWCQNHNTWKVYNCIILDLTEIGLDNLTAQEFYNKYKDKLELLAKGEEITLDSGSGNVNFNSSISSVLPAEYQELDYIESSGTQYIDTGLTSKGRGNTTVELKLSASQSGVDRAFFGEYSNSVIELGQIGDKWRTNVYSTATRLVVNEVKVWEVKADGGWYVDGVRSGTDQIGTAESVVTMRIFGRFYNGSMDKNGSCRVYSCKIWESGILKRNFIPAIRKSDNVIGMYDLVNRVFYANQGTGTFIAGPTKGLPSEYQQVEYIQGDGNQRIKPFRLDKSYTGDLTIGYKFTVDEHNDAMYFSTITSNQSAHQAYSLGYTGASTPLYVRWNQAANSTTDVPYTVGEVAEVIRTNAIENITLGEVSLFAHSIDYRPWKGKIYKYWLKIDDTYLFNFIPCYRKSDGVIGLYNTVNNTFHINAGHGAFVKGPNVTSREIFNLLRTQTFQTLTNATTGYLRASLCSSIDIKDIFTNIIIGHKYFCLYDVRDLPASSLLWRLIIVRDNGNSVIRTADAIHTKNNYAYYNLDISALGTAANTPTAEIWLQLSSGNNYPQGTKYRTMMIDLTNIYGAGHEPSADSFLDMISQYMEDLFNGKSIMLNLSCAPAVKEYGYNQLAMPMNSTYWYYERNNGTVNARTFDEANNSSTYTCDGNNTWFRLLSSTDKVKSSIYTNHYYYVAFDSVLTVNDTTTRNFTLGCSTGVVCSFSIPAGVSRQEKINKYTGRPSIDQYIAFMCSNYTLNVTGDSWTIKDLVLIDLTDWYGQGKEPATVAEFKEKFPNDYYGYCPNKITLTQNMINALPVYGYNQLAEFPQTSGTKWRGYNCTMTASNGVVTCVANGSSYPACASQFYDKIYILDHIYLHLAKFKQDSVVTPDPGAFSINTNGTSTALSKNKTNAVGEWVELYYFGKGKGDSQYQNTFNIQGGATAVSGATFYVKDMMCIDLTDWYGPGNEPTTVEEFKRTFPHKYYPHSKKTLLNRYQINGIGVK